MQGSDDWTWDDYTPRIVGSGKYGQVNFQRAYGASDFEPLELPPGFGWRVREVPRFIEFFTGDEYKLELVDLEYKKTLAKVGVLSKRFMGYEMGQIILKMSIQSSMKELNRKLGL